MVTNNLGLSLPIYVTRPTDKGGAEYSMSLWMSLLAMLLVWANVVVWGFIGLYAAVRVFV